MPAGLFELRPAPLLIVPHAWSGKLHQVAVRIAKVEAAHVRRPIDFRFDGNVVMAKVLVPRAPFGGRNGKTKVELALAMMRWNYSSRDLRRLKRATAFEEEKNLMGSYAQCGKALVPRDFLEPEKLLVKLERNFQVCNMDGCFTDSAY